MSTHAIANAHSFPWSDLGATKRAALTVFLDGQVHTRAELASALGQSVPTAAAHIQALEERGLLQAAEPGGGAGRPASSYRLRPSAAAAIGMELRPGGAHGAAASRRAATRGRAVARRRAVARLYTRVVLLDGTVVCEQVAAVSTEELQSVRSLVEREARNISLNSSVSDLPLVALGLAVPGIVDCERKVLVHAPNLFLWNVSFAGLDEALGIPVVVENEANAAALAEYLLWVSPESAARAGAGVRGTGDVGGTGGGESMVRISITEGVGAGIIVGGSLVRGDTWRAGEFGHMAIREGSRPCNCGRSGCWEQYVSVWALLYDARAAGLRLRSLRGFLNRLARGNREAAHVWHHYVHNLATGIENIVACVDPRSIIVGGDIAQAGELLVVPLRHEVESVSFLTSGVQVDVSRGGGWAAAVGAALLTFVDIYSPTASVTEGVA